MKLKLYAKDCADLGFARCLCTMRPVLWKQCQPFFHRQAAKIDCRFVGLRQACSIIHACIHRRRILRRLCKCSPHISL